MTLTFDDSRTSGTLDQVHKDEEEQLMQLLSDKYGLPYIDLRGIAPEPDALRVISQEDARGSLMAPFKVVGTKIYIALHSPSHQGVAPALAKITAQKLQPILFVASSASLEHVWGRYGDLQTGQKVSGSSLELTDDHMKDIMSHFSTTGELAVYITQILGSDILYKTTRIAEVILAGALKLGASDIHIEPEEERVRLRYRIHGALTDVCYLEFSIFKQLSSRLKILSGLKISTTTTSQDGRFTVVMGDTEIELRVSLVPGNYGESFVMRVLDPRSAASHFDNLGLSPTVTHELERALAKPHGIIVTTGPTGSGKSTTLYAFLRKLYNPEVKIITIEDPIEYHFEGVTQTQVDVKKDYTFLSGLRSSLRQDPDIIMIGEIRDEDTAKVAVNAALTGHLVITTLHTNTAAGTIPRFIELGVDGKTLASALNLAIAQRLVRTLCPQCKSKRDASTREVEIIKTVLATMVIDGKESEMLTFSPADTYTLYDPVGCTECHNGWNGRTAVFELMHMSEEVEVLLTGNPSEREIKKALKSQHIPTLREDAILKVLQGVTSITEAQKVVDLYEE